MSIPLTYYPYEQSRGRGFVPAGKDIHVTMKTFLFILLIIFWLIVPAICRADIPFTGVPWSAVPFWVWACLVLIGLVILMAAVYVFLEQRDCREKIVTARNMGRYSGSLDGRATT